MFQPVNHDDFLEGYYSDACFIPYRFYPSKSLEAAPLMVIFHGAGEVGTDNRKPLEANQAAFIATQWNQHAHVLVCQYPTVYSREFNEDERRFMNDFIDTEVSLINSLQKTYSILSHSINAIALSMGAGIAIQFMLRYPAYFKKVVLIAMRKTTRTSDEIVALNKTDLWIIHGEKDPINACENSIELYTQCLKNGHPSLKFTCYQSTEMENAGLKPSEFHASWILAFNEPHFMDWFNEKALFE